MKIFCAITAAMLLTASLFTGCGCRNSAPANTSEPTTPTIETVIPTTQVTTEPTTRPTTEPTNATIENGNGPLSTNTTTATDSTESNRAKNSGITGSIQ